jgi:hypothetical protein
MPEYGFFETTAGSDVLGLHPVDLGHLLLLLMKRMYCMYSEGFEIGFEPFSLISLGGWNDVIHLSIYLSPVSPMCKQDDYCFLFFSLRNRLYRTRPCRDKPRIAKRDVPGQDTGTSQGHLSSYLLGGAPGERHRALCKTESHCATHMADYYRNARRRH